MKVLIFAILFSGAAFADTEADDTEKDKPYLPDGTLKCSQKEYDYMCGRYGADDSKERCVRKQRLCEGEYKCEVRCLEWSHRKCQAMMFAEYVAYCATHRQIMANVPKGDEKDNDDILLSSDPWLGRIEYVHYHLKNPYRGDSTHPAYGAFIVNRKHHWSYFAAITEYAQEWRRVD